MGRPVPISPSRRKTARRSHPFHLADYFCVVEFEHSLLDENLHCPVGGAFLPDRSVLVDLPARIQSERGGLDRTDRLGGARRGNRRRDAPLPRLKLGKISCRRANEISLRP